MKNRYLLFLCCISVAKIHASEVDYWKGTGLTIGVFKSYILNAKVCAKNKDHFIGCQLAKKIEEAPSRLSKAELLSLRLAAEKEYASGNANPAVFSQKFWKKFRSVHANSEEAALAFLYNMFLEHAYDPHTMLMPMSEAILAQQSDENTIKSGIGVYIGKNDTQVFVAKVYDQGPADRAGLQIGDIIESIDGKKIDASQFRESSRMLTKGKIGSDVTLGIQRGGQVFSTKIQRENVKDPAFSGKIINSNIGYLKIRSFAASDSFDDTREFVLNNRNKVSHWILDLRDNFGGSVEYAGNVAALFTPDVLYNDNGVSFVHKTVYYSKPIMDDAFFFPAFSDIAQKTSLPLLTLINASTASASELVASVLKDNRRTFLVGERSFGKATKQYSNLVNALTPGFDKLPDSILKNLQQTLVINFTGSRFFSENIDDRKLHTPQFTGMTPDFAVAEAPLPGGVQIKRMREEDYFVNPVPPAGASYTQKEAELGTIAELKKCADGGVAKTAEDAPKQNWRDLQLEYAQTLLGCL
jgi:C-terminal peptidase prc